MLRVLWTCRGNAVTATLDGFLNRSFMDYSVLREFWGEKGSCLNSTCIIRKLILKIY